MKFLIKSALISMMAIVAMSSAFAGDWQCKVHNNKGQVWFGAAHHRNAATSKAMAFCISNTKHARNCVIDWCTNNPVPPVKTWQCDVTNARGQSWYGLGPSRGAAASNAIELCARGSKYARNCVIRSCFVR